jgi:hypothetical protein
MLLFYAGNSPVVCFFNLLHSIEAHGKLLASDRPFSAPREEEKSINNVKPKV